VEREEGTRILYISIKRYLIERASRGTRVVHKVRCKRCMLHSCSSTTLWHDLVPLPRQRGMIRAIGEKGGEDKGKPFIPFCGVISVSLVVELPNGTYVESLPVPFSDWNSEKWRIKGKEY
jgi:hypothetical protein